MLSVSRYLKLVKYLPVLMKVTLLGRTSEHCFLRICSKRTNVFNGRFKYQLSVSQLSLTFQFCRNNLWGKAGRASLYESLTFPYRFLLTIVTSARKLSVRILRVETKKIMMT